MIGKQVAHYKITAKIGEGGMGVVYQATDTKLNRDVALKILPEQFATDSQRMGRFQREAEVLASLDHPNIGAIHGIEDVGETKALVLQLIEGPTLADRIAQGPIPVDEALPIALQIAEALEAAHEKGIIHRDLKPANIKITPEGQVKVLDFGLAKAMETDPPSSPDLTQSPTLSMAATRAGLILGTAAYMSPEQAKGKAVDKRADIWAFGAVSYEMLTGGQAFQGEDVSEVMAYVITKEVDLDPLADTPATIRQLISRCLRKDPSVRLRDIGEFRIAIQEYLADPTPDAAVPTTHTLSQSSWQRWIPWASTALLAVALLASFALWPQRDPPLRKFHLAEEGARSPRISPDGTSIAFFKESSFWIRRLDQLQTRKLEGTEGGSNYFWSPDSRFLGFTRDGKLWKIAAAEAGSQILCDLPAGIFRGGSWAADDAIVFSQSQGLYRVSADGGDAERILDIGPGDVRFLSPHSLPDSKGMLFAQLGQAKIELFDGQERRVLLEREGALLSDPVYSATGHLVFTREQSNEGIWAVPFSLSELQVTGDEFKLTSDVGTPSVSGDGTLVYSPGEAGNGLRQLVWVSRTGEVLEAISQPQPGMITPALSRDETQVALAATEQGSQLSIWIHDIDRATKRLLTFSESHQSVLPFWSIQGDQVGYTAFGGGPDSIQIKAADGSSQEVTLAEGSWASFSSDGRYLVYNTRDESTQHDLWYLELSGDKEPQLFLQTQHNENRSRLSPDGNYLAYESNESGKKEVYLRRFPSAEGIWLASNRGGGSPHWSKDGKELYYRQGPDLMVVEVDTTGSGPLRSNPQKLFSGADIDVLTGSDYDTSRDGRFLMIQNVGSQQEGEATEPSIVVIQNWFAEFRDRQ